MNGAPQRILVIKPSALGDVAQCAGVVRQIKRCAPGGHVGWLVNAAYAPLIEGLPFVDAVHVFERGRMRGMAGALRSREYLCDLAARLREQRYELALDLQGLLRSALLGRMSGAGRRAGFAAARECAPCFYHERLRPPSDATHAIDRYLYAIEAVGFSCHEPVDMRLDSTPAEVAAFRGMLAARGFPGDAAPVILCPGARWPSKAWPAEHWAALSDELGRSGAPPCLMLGAPEERDLADRITGLCRRSPPVNLAGETDLRAMAAAMTCASVVITNDSGPMHIAAAQGAPLVALFGPTDPALTGPWRRPGDVIRAGGEPVEHRAYRSIPDDRLMRRIPVDSVLEAALARLDHSYAGAKRVEK